MAEVGDVNRNGQKLIRKRANPATIMINAFGFSNAPPAGANGSDFERLCPKHQDGADGPY